MFRYFVSAFAGTFALCIGAAQAASITASFDLFGDGIDGQTLTSISMTNSGMTLNVRAESTLVAPPPHQISPASIVGNSAGGGVGINGDKFGTQNQTGGNVTHSLVYSVSTAVPSLIYYRLDAITLTHAGYSDALGTLPLGIETLHTATNALANQDNRVNWPLPPAPSDLFESFLMVGIIFGSSDELYMFASGRFGMVDGYRVKRLKFTASDEPLPAFPVPIPPSAVFLLSGLAAMGLIARGRKRKAAEVTASQ